MSNLFVDTIEPEGATTDLTLGDAGGGDKIVIPGTVKISGGSPGVDKVLTSDAAGDATWAVAAGGTNTPSFGAYLAANQSYSNDTWTKITFNTELWDTDSAFDHSTNYRFTVPDGESGKYFFSATTNYDDLGGTTAVGTGHMALYKNGVNLQNHLQLVSARWEYMGATVTTVIELSDNGAGANDYVEFYAYMNQNAATGISMGGQLYTFCSGFKLL